MFEFIFQKIKQPSLLSKNYFLFQPLTTFNFVLAICLMSFSASSMGGNQLFSLSPEKVSHAAAQVQNSGKSSSRASKKKVKRGVPITLSDSLLDLNKGDELEFTTLSGTSYTVVFDHIRQVRKRSLNWVGHIKNTGNRYRVLISIKGRSVTGRINTPDGLMKLKTKAGELRLIDFNFEQFEAIPFINDTSIPEDQPASQNSNIQSSAGQVSSDQNQAAIAAAPTLINGNSIIDVLVLYNGTFASENSGAVSTRIDHLMSLTNQAYLDSEVAMQVRLVGTQQISYTNSSLNSTALRAITNDTISGIDISALRDQTGADLVVIIRPFDYSSHSSCGNAWLNSSLYAAYGYSAVSDGHDIGGSNYYCSDTSFAHELGHNMGLTHDYANAGGGTGSHSYSYGYGINGTFGSIMSYLNPTVEVFSNPNISICNGHTCGTAAYDAARSLVLDKDIISNFKNEVLVNNDADGDGYIDKEDVFPNDSNEWLDNDGDGIGDNGDLDDDNDSMSDLNEVAIGRNPLVNEMVLLMILKD